ncbi:ester cyclase [Arthrobacter sp. Cr_A7]|uniref:ester cyclase n=1 Tax=Arthrobacter sp. Cr_A7 TaxID=3031017 RepID=UPI0023DA6111|nr:ester cyclase [Arthrobacter sp. Cr_A7]MDF2050426.1 ester cyclase [Arthrobacter sp. Cr_A7]
MSTTIDPRTFIAEMWARLDTAESLTVAEEYFAPHYVRHGQKDYSREEFIAILQELRVAFPDLATTVHDTVVEGDRFAYRWESTGTHLGAYLGVPATGRSMTARGIAISRIEGTKIVEDWASWNEASILHDLGIIPLGR